MTLTFFETLFFHPKVFESVSRQRQTTHFMSFLIGIWNALGLVSALILTVAYAPQDVWVISETSLVSANETIWGEASIVPQNIYNFCMALTFASSTIMLLLSVVGILYAAPAPEGGGKKFIDTLGVFYAFLYPAILCVVMCLSLITSQFITYSCVMAKMHMIAFLVCGGFIAGPFAWFLLRRASLSLLEAVHYNDLWVAYYDINNDGFVDQEEVQRVEAIREKLAGDATTGAKPKNSDNFGFM